MVAVAGVTDRAGDAGHLVRALRHLAYARRILGESGYSAPVGQELLVVTADLGIESAWFAHDADEQTLARQLYGQAALRTPPVTSSPRRCTSQRWLLASDRLPRHNQDEE